MKLVKATNLGITTSIEGNLYVITQEGIEVADEIATRLKDWFLHTIEVSDIEAPIVAPQEPVDVEPVVPPANIE